MLSDPTIQKLREMHLNHMAAALLEQLNSPEFNSMSFEDRIGMLVDREYQARKNNRLHRLIREAGFSDAQACPEGIDYGPDRNLNRENLLHLSSCRFIYQHQNVVLLGATGSGKTYIACALGNSAVRNYLSVKYVRLPDLLSELNLARLSDTSDKAIQQYTKPALLILDEWLLYPLNEMEARIVFEIVEFRYRKGSIIFCSQFDVPGWRERISNPLIAEAICDRIVHNTHYITINAKESMRKRMNLIES